MRKQVEKAGISVLMIRNSRINRKRIMKITADSDMQLLNAQKEEK